MKFKDNSIGFQSLKPQIVLALIIVDQIMKESGQEAIITSINDSRHAETSLHYDGSAVDIRSRTFSNPEQVLALCKQALGNSNDFDMILESDHFHLEYQPKRRK
jgi:hypothetical protein